MVLPNLPKILPPVTKTAWGILFDNNRAAPKAKATPPATFPGFSIAHITNLPNLPATFSSFSNKGVNTLGSESLFTKLLIFSKTPDLTKPLINVSLRVSTNLPTLCWAFACSSNTFNSSLPIANLASSKETFLPWASLISFCFLTASLL